MADQPTALITGGAGGIGAAAADRFVTGGWRVAIVDRDEQRAKTVAHSLGSSAIAIGCDVSRPESCHEAVAAGVAWAGRLDHMIAAAGVWSEGPIDDVTEAAVSSLRASRGSMTLIASDAGLQANKGAAVYCASKGAVVLLAKTLALDLGPDGVRVNAVCPGDVMSPMLERQAETYGGGDPAAYFETLLGKYPQGSNARFTQPGEVAEFLWFLAQPGAAPITGAALSIDFGLSSGIL